MCHSRRWENCTGRWTWCSFKQRTISQWKWCTKQAQKNNNTSCWPGTGSCVGQNAKKGIWSVFLWNGISVWSSYMVITSLPLLQVFKLERLESKLEALCIQSDLTVNEMLERVLRLPAVASKRYLTNKVCWMFVMTVTDRLSKSLLIPIMTNCYLAFVTYHFSSDKLTNKNVV